MNKKLILKKISIACYLLAYTLHNYAMDKQGTPEFSGYADPAYAQQKAAAIITAMDVSYAQAEQLIAQVAALDSKEQRQAIMAYVDDKGNSLFTIAALKFWTTGTLMQALMNILLNAGFSQESLFAILNQATHDSQETALTYAACIGFTEKVEVLIQGAHQADLTHEHLFLLLNHVTPRCGYTALMNAAQENKADVVFALIRGAHTVGLTYDYIRTMCMQACQYSTTALFQAAERGHASVVKALLEAVGAIDMPSGYIQEIVMHVNADGWSALHIACHKKHGAMTVEMLLTLSERIGRMNATQLRTWINYPEKNFGMTPLTMARKNPTKNYLETFLENLDDENPLIKSATFGMHSSVSKEDHLP